MLTIEMRISNASKGSQDGRDARTDVADDRPSAFTRYYSRASRGISWSSCIGNSVHIPAEEGRISGFSGCYYPAIT